MDKKENKMREWTDRAVYSKQKRNYETLGNDFSCGFLTEKLVEYSCGNGKFIPFLWCRDLNIKFIFASGWILFLIL